MPNYTAVIIITEATIHLEKQKTRKKMRNVQEKGRRKRIRETRIKEKLEKETRIKRKKEAKEEIIQGRRESKKNKKKK